PLAGVRVGDGRLHGQRADLPRDEVPVEQLARVERGQGAVAVGGAGRGGQGAGDVRGEVVESGALPRRARLVEADGDAGALVVAGAGDDPRARGRAAVDHRDAVDEVHLR